ncbi:MAG: four helix bundle protein [Verrucomicrobia bacterium]|nr:four helix bundle protein [Verrucomicrobiota bacterium]
MTDTSFQTGDAEPNGLEERTFRFAKEVRAFIKTVPVTISHREDIRQLVRASGSVAANFIEAIEAVGPKDYVFRLKVSRKEAKESRLWLRLLSTEEDPVVEKQRLTLVQEAIELIKILSSVIRRRRA